MPLQISVITAVLNRAETLADALRSVHGQTWRHVEHLVVDGGSTDGTLDVIDRHRSGVATMMSSADEGPYYALNKGIARATGDVIGFMHADDTYENPQVLEKIAHAFEDPAVGAV